MRASGYVYSTSAGETFDLAAMTIFGSEKYAPELMSANPEYTDRLVFDGSEELVIPIMERRPGTVTAAAPWKE